MTLFTTYTIQHWYQLPLSLRCLYNYWDRKLTSRYTVYNIGTIAVSDVHLSDNSFHPEAMKTFGGMEVSG